MHFADRLLKIVENTSSICVGIDPVLSKIPNYIKKGALEECGEEKLEAVSLSLAEFGIGIIDAMDGLAGICKIQLAFFEMYGSFGLRAYEEICKYAKEKGVIVIADGKRNDIGSTSQAYADGFLGKVDVFGDQISLTSADGLTVNPYLGTDSVHPFIEVCKQEEKGIFVLVKTSNPGSSDFQDLPIGEEMLSEEVARHVSNWGMGDLGETYFSSVGAVVGATHIEDAKYLRTLMPNQIFLVPGYGAQGGSIEGVRTCFNSDKRGAIINSSRAINYAYLNNSKYSDENFIDAARDEIVRMKDEISAI